MCLTFIVHNLCFAVPLVEPLQHHEEDRNHGEGDAHQDDLFHDDLDLGGKGRSGTEDSRGGDRPLRGRRNTVGNLIELFLSQKKPITGLNVLICA